MKTFMKNNLTNAKWYDKIIKFLATFIECKVVNLVNKSVKVARVFLNSINIDTNPSDETRLVGSKQSRAYTTTWKIKSRNELKTHKTKSFSQIQIYTVKVLVIFLGLRLFLVF